MIFFKLKISFLVPPAHLWPFFNLDSVILSALTFHLGNLKAAYKTLGNLISFDENFIPVSSQPLEAEFVTSKKGKTVISLTRKFLPQTEEIELQDILKEDIPGAESVMKKGIVNKGFSKALFSQKVLSCFVKSLIFLLGTPTEDKLPIILYLLKDQFFSLGKFASRGWGIIHKIETTVTKKPPWPFDNNGKLLRPYPVSLLREKLPLPDEIFFDYLRPIPPYWERSGRVKCAFSLSPLFEMFEITENEQNFQ